jgi:tRNA(Ile)-lysidine synthase
MIDRFKNFLLSKIPNLKEKSILLAISGGVDSVALLHLLKHIDFKIILAHANFQLRGKESDGDAIFVKKLAKGNHLQLFCKNFTIKSTDSTQEKARELRYNWFQELILKNNIDYLATAHHSDDQIETFFLNLFRGAGVKGLSAMPFANKNHIRPLLIFSKNEIENYAKENKLMFRLDSSNISDKYQRNYIRHHITPAIESLNKNNLQSILKSVENFQNTYQFITASLDNFKKEISIERNGAIVVLKSKLIAFTGYKFLLHYFLEQYNFTSGKTDEFIKLLESENGKKITSTSHTIIKTKSNEFTIFHNHIFSNETLNYPFVFKLSKKNTTINQPINLKIKKMSIEEVKSFDLEKNKILIDEEKLSNNDFTIRHINKSDYFTPFGLKQKVNVLAFLKKQKVNDLSRKSTFVMENNNKIVWVMGVRLADQFKCTKNTIKVVKFQLLEQ